MRIARMLLAAAPALWLTFPAALGAQQPAMQKAPAAGWSSAVEETRHGHRIGNPEAEVMLVEYMSYTCSHCARFAREGDGPIRMLYVPTGKISYEIRHLVRDPVDLTAALAAQCGAPARFPGNHEAIMARFDRWMAAASTATQAQQVRWSTGTFGARARAIAGDLDFYEIMEGRGYSRAALDQCLNDEGKARALAQQSSEDIAELGLQGTPTFFLNGERLASPMWAGVQQALDAAM